MLKWFIKYAYCSGSQPFNTLYTVGTLLGIPNLIIIMRLKVNIQI